MKKLNKLFAILFAVLGVTTLKAQTDVTSTYLTNAGFEETHSRFLDVNTDRGVEKPFGWSVEWYQDNNDKNGMTFVAESMTQDEITWSGKSGKSYFARMRWGNATLYLRQTLQNLRPGDYNLSFSVAGHTTNAANTVQVSVAGQTQSITLGNNANGNWTDYSIDFNITETTPYATVEFKAVRGGDLLKIGVDEFKLMYDGSSYYESIISKAQALYDNNKDWAENGLADFETAISDNKGKQTIAEINEAIVALENAMATFKSLNSVDVTVKINNPNFDSNIDGWTKTGGDGNGFQRQTSTQPNFAGGFLEKWRNAWNGGYNQKDFDVYQEISNLPNGEYTVNAYIQAQMQGGKETLGDSYKDKKHGGPYYIDNNNGVWMYATSGDNSSNVWANTHNPNFGETGGGVLRTASVKVTNGVLKIGFKGIGSPNGGTQLGTYANWIACDTWTLSYFGFDPTTLLSQLESLKDEANSLLNNEEYKTVVGAERTDLMSIIEYTPEETKTGLETAVTQLELLINAFKAATSDYATLATEKEIAAGLGMSEESIASATATTKTGLVALQDLKVAEYNYIQGTYTENATLGSWTEDFNSDLDGEGYKAGGPKYLDDWQANKTTRTTKQTVTLPAGDYALSVIARGQAGASGNLYYKIGDVTTDIALIMKGNRGRGVDVNEVANFSEEGEYNCNGEGFGWEYRFITFHLDTETQVEIGASVTIQGQWASVYAPVLLTTESSVKVLRMTEIANLLSTVPTGKMNATVQSTLNEKKDAAEAASVDGNTIDELETITTELNEAIIAAKTSIAEYEKIATYIAKANTIDGSIAADVQTQYDNGTLENAEPVFQDLEVATYNYVTSNFTYEVALKNTWNSNGTNTAAADFNNEHWSGETRSYKNQQDGDNWGWGAQSWSIDFDQEVTLPAGEYVFKVAGRKSEGTTLELVVTKEETTLGTVEDFPSSNNTKGINKAGAASFDPEDPEGFANNGNGYGWQWRYVRFELNSESTVKVAVHAETNAVHNWVSFGDYTLQMTEETYLAANMGGLDAPMAAAQALVGTKPMGAAENEALQDAIDMPVTTGAELKAKIDALNTAVANANAWIPKYNEAKAPLVAALERFEADYNDAQNGALNHMNKDRWATAVNMAQAAAVAKDVTDSYEGFATATENLVAALDAATVSIGEYSNLKTAIDAAGTLYNSANWGDAAFQKPIDAKEGINTAKVEAQAAYDAAEVDGDDVTAVIESLNNTVNGIVLNAPEDGQRFNIVMDFEGWEHHGKAATYLANDRNDAGLYNIQYYAAPNANYAQAFTFTAVAGQPDCYTLSMTDVDNNERYVCTGTVYGGNARQIRTTTDASQALAVKVIATATEGIHQLWNTEAENYIGGQDAGFYTTSSHTTFRLQEAQKAEVTLNITDAGWATLILPFNAEIPEGVTVYGSNMIDGDLLKLSEAVSIVANTPYLVNGTEGTYNFSGYGLAEKDSYADANGFVGTYVDYATTVGDYVLQKQGNAVAFYIVGESAQPTVKPYRCYLTAPASEIKAFFIFDDGATGINGVDAADAEIEAIYTVNGVKVNSLQKGLNIVKMSNGKTQKVLVK